MKTFYCVTTIIRDNDHILKNTMVISSWDFEKKPDDSFKSFARKDVYHDWFDTLEEAEQFVEENKE